MGNPGSTYWGNKPWLYKAANDRLLVVCKCLNRRRTMAYYAVDLMEVFHGNSLIGELWGRCPRCGSTSNWSERLKYPSSDDVGRLQVRRPNGYRRTLMWKTEYYSPPPFGPRHSRGTQGAGRGTEVGLFWHKNASRQDRERGRAIPPVPPPLA